MVFCGVFSALMHAKTKLHNAGNRTGNLIYPAQRDERIIFDRYLLARLAIFMKKKEKEL